MLKDYITFILAIKHSQKVNIEIFIFERRGFKSKYYVIFIATFSSWLLINKDFENVMATSVQDLVCFLTRKTILVQHWLILRVSVNFHRLLFKN